MGYFQLYKRAKKVIKLHFTNVIIITLVKERISVCDLLQLNKKM